MKNNIKAPKNYILIPQELMDNPKLNYTDCLIYGYLRKMMNLSLGNDYFYDKYKRYYFIIYPREKLSAKTGKSINTIGRSFNRLEKCDYIRRSQKGRFRGKKIRLPKTEPYFKKDHLKPISNPGKPKMVNRRSSKTITRTTPKMGNRHAPKLGNPCSNNIGNNNTGNNKMGSVHSNTKKNTQAVFRWRYNIQSRVGLPKGAVDRIIAFVEYKYNHFDKAKADKMISLINESRNSILKSYRKDGITIPKEKSRFENKEVQKMLGTNLGLYLGQTIYNTKHNHKTPNINHYFGYLVSELKDDFENWLKPSKSKNARE